VSEESAQRTHVALFSAALPLPSLGCMLRERDNTLAQRRSSLKAKTHKNEKGEVARLPFLIHAVICVHRTHEPRSIVHPRNGRITAHVIEDWDGAPYLSRAR
jgi:hypothetical protein